MWLWPLENAGQWQPEYHDRPPHDLFSRSFRAVVTRTANAMASARNPLRRIAFIGPPSLRNQHDGCQAQGKGVVDAGVAKLAATQSRLPSWQVECRAR